MKIFKKVKKLLIYTNGYGVLVVKSLITGVLNRFFSVGIVLFASYIVGAAVSGCGESEIVKLSAILVGIGVLKALSAYGEMYYVHDLAYSILFDYRNRVYKQLGLISPAYLLKDRTGNIASTIMEDVEQLEVFYAHTFTAYVVSILSSIALVIVTFLINPVFLAIIVPALLFIIIVPYLLLKKGIYIGEELRRRLGDIHGELIDYIQGIKEILSFNKRDKFLAEVEKKSEELGRVQLREGVRSGIQSVIIGAILTLALFAVSLTANYLYSSGEMSSRWIPVITILAIYIFGPIVGVSNTASSLGVVDAAGDRIFRIMEEKPCVRDEGSESLEKAFLPINFSNVHFKYVEQIDVLKGVDFTINPNEKIAVVGESGAGKSTIVYLMLRFYDADKGNIFMGEKNIRDISLHDLRDTISYVSQDIYLFNDTVENNIKIGSEDASEEEVRRAAKLAFAHDFIMKFKDGYHTVVGERGAKVSAGQKQRIAIARALLKKSPVVIFDEAVSNLDAGSEAAVNDAISNLSEGKTVITVAHRISTIKKADRVLFIRKGMVEDTGSHEELLRRSANYRSLMRREF